MWRNILKHKLSKGKGERKRFNTSFDDYVSNELQKVGVLCWLRHQYNWFSKTNKNVIWRGKFRCINENCTNVFNCVISPNYSDQGVKLLINWKEKASNHFQVLKPKRCTGEDRKKVAFQLLAHGNVNVKQDYELNSFLNPGN